jgi:hypothetical protein
MDSNLQKDVESNGCRSKAFSLGFAVLVFSFTLAIGCMLTPILSSSLFPNENFIIGTIILWLLPPLVLAVGAYLLWETLQQRVRVRQQSPPTEFWAQNMPAGEKLLASARGRRIEHGPTPIWFRVMQLFEFIFSHRHTTTWEDWENFNGTDPRGIYYYVGLTQNHLLIVQAKGEQPTQIWQILPHSEVQSIDYDASASALSLRFTRGYLNLCIFSDMYQRAKELAAIWRSRASV